jgi:thioredoxin 1
MYIKTPAKVITAVLFISLFATYCDAGKKDAKSDSTKSSKTDSSSQKVKKLEEKQAIKATFIELGSVNCIPCKMMKPVMDAVEKEYAGQVKVIFYDVWTKAGEPYAKKYGIRAIPTQVFLDADGKEYFRHQGFFPKEELVKILKQKGVK